MEAKTKQSGPTIIPWVMGFLWALSGFSVLAMEGLWMRMVALRAGNTAVASTLVVCAFFGFAALGNWLGSRRSTGNVHPLRVYAVLEIIAGLAAAFGLWFEGLISAFPGLVAGTATMAIISTVVLAGPTSMLAGASFPRLVECIVTGASHRTSDAGRLYGLNLVGAALGVTVGGVLIPWWVGVKVAFVIAASLQVVGGGLAWLWASRVPRGERSDAPSNATEATSCGRAGWIVLVLSGVLSLAAQTVLVVWARQVFEGSIYTTSAVLATFLGGLSSGAWMAGHLRGRGRSSNGLMIGFGAMGALMLFVSAQVLPELASQNLFLMAQSPEGLLFEVVWKVALLVVPLACALGGVFPLVWEWVRLSTGGEGRVMGVAASLNKWGAAAGAVLALFILIPVCGLGGATVALGGAYWLLAIFATWIWSGSKQKVVLLLVVIGLFGCWCLMNAKNPMALEANHRLIDSYSGAYGPVVVVENGVTGSRHIVLNTKQRLSGTRGALPSQWHQSWVPLLLNARPDRVVTIGMAAGISAAAALDAPLKELKSIELVPEVVAAARKHFAPWNEKLFSDPRSQVLVGDGRTHLARLHNNMDLLIGDLFFPTEEGSALLYSEEFFHLVRGKLAADGAFCLWLPCYQHTPQTAGLIISTFRKVFPHAIMVRANFDPQAPVVGLLGSGKPIPLSRLFLQKQLAQPWARGVAERSPFFRSAEHAMLMIVCDLHSAEPAFGDGHLITDDHPTLAWLGPRVPTGRERLHGFPFLDWVGKRALGGMYPSCDLGDLPPSELTQAVRAGNFYFAAAASNVVLPGDARPDAIRVQQSGGYLHRAAELWPAALLSIDDLGK
jgi:spermidine synthase